MTGTPAEYSGPLVENMIRTVRGQKVILDRDLAELYGVETKMLNRAIKRNAQRFPLDFAFQLTAEEEDALRCQNGTSKGRGGPRYLSHVFTEHGAIMAANVPQSRQAIEMSIFVVRAFIKMRKTLLNRGETDCSKRAGQSRPELIFLTVVYSPLPCRLQSAGASPPVSLLL